MELLSIIIPVFNGARTIRECVSSVIEQDYYNKEIIIVNDGSNDDTEKICMELDKCYREVRFFSQNNMGVSVARNKGLAESKGEYIAFLDCDDKYLPNSFSCAIEFMERERADIVIGGIIKCVKGEKIRCIAEFEDGLAYKVYENESLIELCRWILERDNEKCVELPCKFKNGKEMKNAFRMGSPCAKIMRRSVALSELFDDSLVMCEDLIYINSIMKHVEKVVIIKKEIYKYQCSETSVSTVSYLESAKKAYENLAKKYVDLLDDYDKKYQKALHIKIIDCCWSGIKRGIISNKTMDLGEKIREIDDYVKKPVYINVLKNLSMKDMISISLKIKLFTLKYKMSMMIILFNLKKVY